MNTTTEIRELSADEIEMVTGGSTSFNVGGVFQVSVGKGYVSIQVGNPNMNEGAGVVLYKGGHVSGYVGGYSGHT